MVELRAPASVSRTAQVSLWELATFFLRLGTTAFGGPAAHVGIMEDELVRRRAWLSRETFLDLLGATNLIPGPSSSELAIHIGYWCAGWQGLIIAGSCFVLPAALMVGGLGWLYVHFGKLPATAGILYGIKPVVIAIIIQALCSLGRTAVKTTFLAFVAVISLCLILFSVHPLLLLLAAGTIACLPQLREFARVLVDAARHANSRRRAGDDSVVEFNLIVFGVLEDGRYCLWQRLCAARIPSI